MTQPPLQRRLIRLASAINRKAERLGVPGRVSAESLLLIIQGNPVCPYCGDATDSMHGSFDHRVPFDRGGSNLRENITFGHLSCNRNKYTKSPSEHAEYQALTVTCPIDGKEFRPRHADWKRGLGRFCSRSCSAASRWSAANE